METAEDWLQKRRLEILELFREHVYGRSPGAPEQMHFDVFDEDRHYLERYNDKESDLPVDQHMLIALIAPRPVAR